MRACLPLLLALLVLGAEGAGVAGEGLPAPAAIDTAIDAGVDWLLQEQKPQGTWGSGTHALGKTSLAVYALLHAGLAEGQGSRASRRLERAFAFLDRNGAGLPRRREVDTRTYEASLLLMLLRSRGREQDRGRMQRLATLLLRTQATNGQWWYDGRGAPTAGDNSNTQFATLALGQACAEGLVLSAVGIRRSLDWWLASQGRDGGFGYASGGSPKSAASGSMTAAGIACIAIGRILSARLGPQPTEEHADGAKASQAQARALDFLARVFSVTRNHGPGLRRKGQKQRQGGRGWLHYYLWTVERALVLSERDTLGPHDWYSDGARHLLATQKRDGSWRGEHPLYATCFALLFLTRAADPPRAFTPEALPALPGPRTAPVTPAAPSRREPEPGQAPDPQAAQPSAPLPPGTVGDWLLESLPPGELPRRIRLAGAGALPPLVAALQNPDRAQRQRAFEALCAVLPEGRTTRVDRHPLARGRLALWLRLYGRHLKLREGVFRMP